MTGPTPGTCPQYPQNTVYDLLAECTARGVDLQPQGDGLAIDGPDAELTADLLARLREHKAELLTILAAPTAPATMDPDLTAALAGLTPADLAYYHTQLAARRDAREPAPGIEWRALVDVRVDRGHWPAAPVPVPRRRLVGCGFPACPGPPPDPHIIDPPAPCPTCGGITRWQDGIGRWRCPTCDPPSGVGARLRAAVETIRARHPAGTGDMS